MMNRTISILLASMGVSGTALALEASPPVATPVSEAGGIVRLAVNPPSVATGETIIVPDFPLPGGDSVSLELTAQDAFAPDARIVLVRNGVEEPVAVPEMTLLSGRVLGDKDSRAFLGFIPGSTQGFIFRHGKSYIISSGKPGSGLPPVVYDLASLPEGSVTSGRCFVEGDVGLVPGTKRAAPFTGDGSTRASAPCRRADIAVETDYELFQRFGSSQTNATAYVALLFTAVSDIYQNELNTRLRISFLRLWATADDPWTVGDSGGTLDQFLNYWNANMSGTPRHLAHFLSMRGLGGGVAYLNVLCNSTYGYGVSGNLAGSFPYPVQNHRAQNWDLMVVAHELGHNFGTGHTHDSYTPIIDGCGNGDCSQANTGTIMSYCHTCSGGMTNINMFFGPRVTERILQYLNNEAGCSIAADAQIQSHPANRTATEGRSATFVVIAGGGTGTYSYQWRKNGTPLNVPTAHDHVLSLTNIAMADAGMYDCVVSTECSSVTSNAARLTVRCLADFDGNGFINGADFDLFVYAFEGGLLAADINRDGFVNGIDFDLFVEAFESPCP